MALTEVTHQAPGRVPVTLVKEMVWRCISGLLVPFASNHFMRVLVSGSAASWILSRVDLRNTD